MLAAAACAAGFVLGNWQAGRAAEKLAAAADEKHLELRGEFLERYTVLIDFPRANAPAGAKPEGRVWQNVEVTTFAVWSGLKLEPYVLEQHSPLADGLARNWPRADAGAAEHGGYALQWYSLAALSAVLLFALCIRRERKSAA